MASLPPPHGETPNPLSPMLTSISTRNLNAPDPTSGSGSPSSSSNQQPLPPPPRQTYPAPPGPSKTFTIDIPMAPDDYYDYEADLAGPLEALRLTHEHALDLLVPHVPEAAEDEEFGGEQFQGDDDDNDDDPEWADHASASVACSSAALSQASSLPVGASALSTSPSCAGIGPPTASNSAKEKDGTSRRARTLASMRLQPQFNLDSAGELLRRFREAMLSHFHCVAVREDETVPSMARERPFVLLAVLAAASGSATLQGHGLYDEEFRKVLGLKFVAGGERSLELLQGLVVYISWYVSSSESLLVCFGELAMLTIVICWAYLGIRSICGPRTGRLCSTFAWLSISSRIWSWIRTQGSIAWVYRRVPNGWIRSECI
jgi:hypothetical protein